MRIQPVILAADKGRIAALMEYAPTDLKDLVNKDFITLDRSDIDYWNVGVQKVIKAAGFDGAMRTPSTGSAQAYAQVSRCLPRKKWLSRGKPHRACSLLIFLGHLGVGCQRRYDWAARGIVAEWARCTLVLLAPSPTMCQIAVSTIDVCSGVDAVGCG